MRTLALLLCLSLSTLGLSQKLKTDSVDLYFEYNLGVGISTPFYQFAIVRTALLPGMYFKPAQISFNVGRHLRFNYGLTLFAHNFNINGIQKEFVNDGFIYRSINGSRRLITGLFSHSFDYSILLKSQKKVFFGIGGAIGKTMGSIRALTYVDIENEADWIDENAFDRFVYIQTFQNISLIYPFGYLGFRKKKENLSIEIVAELMAMPFLAGKGQADNTRQYQGNPLYVKSLNPYASCNVYVQIAVPFNI